jgi:hypothetical protein
VLGETSGIVEFRITAEHFAWDSNGVMIEAELAQVVFVLTGANPASSPSDLYVEYGINPSGYEFTGGPSPSYIRDYPVAIGWREDLNSGAYVASVTAINPTVQQNDSTMTFVAGALVGVAGGALIGAVQELFHR